ncbi:hypothetical protein QTP88_024772 [Uroleucon formosanum]
MSDGRQNTLPPKLVVYRVSPSAADDDIVERLHRVVHPVKYCTRVDLNRSDGRRLLEPGGKKG